MIQRIPCEIDGKMWAVTGTTRCRSHLRHEDLQKLASYRMMNGMDKKLLIEKIETKIEEFRENIADEIAACGKDFPEDHQFDNGAIAGLLLAIDILNE